MEEEIVKTSMKEKKVKTMEGQVARSSQAQLLRTHLNRHYKLYSDIISPGTRFNQLHEVGEPSRCSSTT